jgi:Flp pilus assembly protein TadG
MTRKMKKEKHLLSSAEVSMRSHIKSRLSGAFRRWLADNSGAIAFIFALSLPMIIGAAGLTVDLSQAYNVQERLGAALDKAALAAGSTNGTEEDIDARVQSFFDANYPSEKLGTPYDVTTTLGDSTVTVSAHAKVNTAFMKILGQDYIDVYAQSTVKREVAGLELVLVMDNTGSMADPAGGSETKIEAAKTAATSLVNILYGPSSNVPKMWISLIPFSQDVNIGTGNSAFLSGDGNNWGTTSWGGCVEMRRNGQDMTDDPPSAGAFTPYYAACSSSNYNANGQRNQWWWTTSTKTSHGRTTTTYNYCSGSGTKYYQSPLNTVQGPNTYCAQPLTQMTQDKQTILDGIDSMQPIGGTIIPTGMAWAWRMLSPRWRGVWPGTMENNDLPLDYDSPAMNKVVILMTDGDNSFGSGDYTAYGALNEGRLGTSNSNTANSVLNSKTKDLCDSMKSHDITIYTIALGEDINSTSANMLKNCASKSAYYFASPTTDDLESAFETIANQLNSLHITN